VEVEVLLTDYVQAGYEVCFKRKIWEWWIHYWEEVYDGKLRYGRRSRRWWRFHVSTLVAPFVIIELKVRFDFQTATAVQPRLATRIFDPRFTSSEILYVVGRAVMYFVILWLFRPYWNSNRQLLHWIDNCVVLSLTRRCRELFPNQ